MCHIFADLKISVGNPKANPIYGGYEISRNEISQQKITFVFREILLNTGKFQFRIYFVFCEIKKSTFVSTLVPWPQFINEWSKCLTNSPIAYKYEIFPLFSLVNTEEAIGIKPYESVEMGLHIKDSRRIRFHLGCRKPRRFFVLFQTFSPQKLLSLQ
jgi:hypothetical protein